MVATEDAPLRIFVRWEGTSCAGRLLPARISRRFIRVAKIRRHLPVEPSCGNIFAIFDAAGTTELRSLHFLFSRCFDNVAAIDLAALNLEPAGAEEAAEGAEIRRQAFGSQDIGGVDQHVVQVRDESVTGKTDFTDLLTLPVRGRLSSLVRSPGSGERSS
jgi:hypothetical protein